MAAMKKKPTGRSADASAGAAAAAKKVAAAAANRAKVKGTAGTADSKARRSTRGMEKYGIPSRNPGTSPDYQFHVTGSRTTRPNGGKRISEKRSESGYTQEHFSSAPNDSQWVGTKTTRNTSDAIVTPTIKKKAAAKKTGSAGPKKTGSAGPKKK
jgi:hypothetical protein